MGNMRGTEQHVARTNCGYRFLDSIMAASGGDEIEFIALMRDLRSVGGAGGESDLKITVNEHFGRSPWCPWQSERGGERHWGGDERSPSGHTPTQFGYSDSLTRRILDGY